MISESQLNDLLQHWRREYGPGGMALSQGQSIIQTLIDHKGQPPSSGGSRRILLGTSGDDVESAVFNMGQIIAPAPNRYFRAANVLRVEYLTPNHWPESERLQKLSRIGLRMKRDAYYDALNFGRAYLMGYLSKREIDAA